MPNVTENPLSSPARKTNGKTSPQVPATAGRESATPAQMSRIVSPLALMRHLIEEMDGQFANFGLRHRWGASPLVSRTHELLRREAGLIPADWSPRVDVFVHDGQFVVRADLPGLTKDEVKVEIKDDMITIEGERREAKNDEQEGCYYSERTYGRFFRSIPLPDGAETAKASAHFQAGVLEVSMPVPRATKPAPRRLEIQDRA